MHVLLQGFHFDKLYLFGDYINHIHIADKKPIKFAQMHREILFDENFGRLIELRNSKIEIAELLKRNTDIRNVYLNLVKKNIYRISKKQIA
jgi:hypothetical protein